MLFALICDDKPDAGDLRVNTRESHLDYLNSLGDDLKFAGPFLDTSGNPTGSLVVVDAVDAEAAQGIADRDPYSQAGLFSNVAIRRWNWSVKNPEA